MKMPLLFLGTQMAVGGAQRMLMIQAAWFKAQGYPIWVAYFYDKEGLHEKWQSEYDFPIINLDGWRFGASPFSNASRLIGALGRLWRLLREHKISVIETFTPHSDMWGLPVAWLARVPVRIGCYQGIIQTMPDWQAWIHARLVNTPIITRFVGVSNQMVQLAIEAGIKPEKVVMIPNAVDIPSIEDDAAWRAQREALRLALGVPEDSVLAITSARLDREKGHTYLLQAIPPVLEAFPRTIFAFGGDGYLRAGLEQQATELGIDRNVRFLGIRHDLPALLRAADIYILPSLAEGLSLAMLEAMVAELPVLVTRVQGSTDVITSGKNGVLVPPADPSALTQALLALLQHPENWAALGQTARQTVLEDYTIERISQQYEQLFLHESGVVSK
jgi:glycosyltransferase involved in cell wall biosynthesis